MKSRFLTVRDDCLTEVTLPSGSSEVTFVQVQVPLPAPLQKGAFAPFSFFRFFSPLWAQKVPYKKFFHHLKICP